MRAVGVLESKAIIQKAAAAFKKELDRRGLFVLDSSCRTILDKLRLGIDIVPYKLGEMERRLAEMLWERAPLRTRDLVAACAEAFAWKRTTPYTIIKRLGERGILKNENGLVTSLVSKDEAQACEIDELVEKKFEGSLPTFIAAFTKRQDLSAHELDEVQQMIDRIRRGETQ